MNMKMIIGGKKVDSRNGRTLQVFNPATGELLDTVPDAAEEDIREAVELSLEGKKVWGNTPLFKRSEILRKFLEIVEERKNELAVLLSTETGKTVRESAAEVDTLLRVFRGYIEKANHFYGITVPDSQAGLENDIIFTRREPLGVIVLVIPFNFPIDLFSHKAAPALISGNSIIVKPSSDNPLAIIRLVELLIEAGVPESAVQIVTGRGAVLGKWLISSPKINAVSLTGSTDAGIEVAKESAPHLHRFYLELGGNDALIVYSDADIDLAVEEAVFARTLNAGQTCCAAKRFIVEKPAVEEFTAKLIERLKNIKIGNPLDPETEMGCLISEKAAVKVEEQVIRTVEQGAKCIYGGKRLEKAFFQPTVLADVTAAMDVAQNMEIFGPVFPVIAFDTMEEALEIVNQSMYGLMGGVMSRDMNKAMKTAAGMESGGIVINGAGNYRSLEIPFGGYKKSGIGREGISYTLEEMTQVKTIIMKKVLL
jgi:acyl-CoA reductase-like NAD-dependent aldehyde dehydrogenase